MQNDKLVQEFACRDQNTIHDQQKFDDQGRLLWPMLPPSTTIHENDDVLSRASGVARETMIRASIRIDDEPLQDEQGNFYCGDPRCINRTVKFARKCEWKKHRDTHTRPYVCKVLGCEKIQGFTYSGGLLRHEREVHQRHGGPIRRHFCPHTDCKRSEGQGFSHKENLIEHLRRVHRNKEIDTSNLIKSEPALVSPNTPSHERSLGSSSLSTVGEWQGTDFGEEISSQKLRCQLETVTQNFILLRNELEQTKQENSQLKRDVRRTQHNEETNSVLVIDSGESKSFKRQIYRGSSKEHFMTDLVSSTDLSYDQSTDSGYASSMSTTGKIDRLLVSELVKALESLYDDENLPENIISVLPDLLGTFALKLGYESRGNIDYYAIDLIFRRRNEIVSTLLDQWQSHIRTIQKTRANEMNSDSSARLITHYRYSPSPSFEQEPHYLSKESEEPHETVWYESDLDYVRMSPAYIWFIQKLTNFSRLTYLEASTVSSIQQTTHDCFPKPQNVNSQVAGFSQTMVFNIDWPLVKFLQDYQFDGADDIADVLQNFVTITGNGNCAQAMAALQYCRLVWGHSGERILSFIADLARDGKAELATADFVVIAQIDTTMTCFKVVGLSDSIAEIGEQLAWMGAVFRASPVSGRMYDCITSVTRVRCETGRTPSNMPGVQSYCCEITYHITASRAVPDLGSCWYGLFRYGVIAYGFPIAKRAASFIGLEMTLDIMLALCHARHIGKVNDNIVIKGFASMFSLSEHQQGACIWHFSGDIDGPYISYPCAPLCGQFPNLDVHDILHDRHFVGWCHDASYGVGALDSNYRVQTSGIRLTYPGCLLHDKTLRRGQTYPVAKVYIADSREMPRRTANQSLQERLRRIHIRPVVLWDDNCERGWLTNGTSALLHLTLASVENNDSPFDTYCLRKEEIRQRNKHTINAAACVLLDEHNWKLPIQLDDGRPVSFRDRVEDLCFLLEVATEHQITSLLNNRMSSGILEGWDFMDIAGMAIDPLNPRAFPLTKDCRGWMTFLEDTRAVTLFGNNFGDIFQPRSVSCAYWSTLPKHNCYLAANICDLEVFAQAYHGDSKSNPRRLTANTIWQNSFQPSAMCNCSESTSKHVDLVQTLVPEDMFDKVGNLGVISSVQHQGVVIFGKVKDCKRSYSSLHSFHQPNSFKRARYEIDGSPNNKGISDSVSSITAMDPTVPTFLEYLVAIICALPEELLAVRQLFDQKYANVEFDKHDENSYVFGKISCHNIVAACLPGIYGTCSAAHLITELKRSFPNVEFCLLVGIGGGIPSKRNDIRLGDVVVSCPQGSHSGTIKHDFLRITQGSRSTLLGCQREPPSRLLSAISLVRSNPDHLQGPAVLQKYINDIVAEHPEYSFPGTDLDILYEPDHCHDMIANSCSACQEHVIQRSSRATTQPYIHYGLIASGDQVIKDSKTRDHFAQQYNALCFEMEAAGIVNIIPSLIIRGICDYADSHKNDNWNKYAAATAAAYAKFILDKVRLKNCVGQYQTSDLNKRDIEFYRERELT